MYQAKEAQNSQDWQECIDAANRVLKNEPTADYMRFNAFDKYVDLLELEKG